MKNDGKVMKVKGIEVHVNCRDPRKHKDEVASALSEFKKLVKKAELMQELRKREHYVAPSKKRRLKHDESIKQRKRDQRKAEWFNKKNDV